MSDAMGEMEVAYNIETSENFDDFFFRFPLYMVFIYCIFYGSVFIVGFLGNVFVVLAVASHQQLRSTTDYLISSLAMADLLIMIFCLPTTLLNNILIEWPLGLVMCKLSTWINTTTSCASIYTLVAVTADRYLAICHTLKYTLWDASYTLYVIAAIWFCSGIMASPLLFKLTLVKFGDNTSEIIICMIPELAAGETQFFSEKLYFVVVNLILAFIVPFLLISVFYTMIFITVSTHRSLAVDAHIRDERVKLRVAKMMLTVIVVFALCWFPLYAIFTYFHYLSKEEKQTSAFFDIASNDIRPIFQWLSLVSSSLNPLIYIAYSQKYRRAFHRLLLLPCRSRYERVRGTLLRNNESMITTTCIVDDQNSKKMSSAKRLEVRTFRAGTQTSRTSSESPHREKKSDSTSF